MTRAVVYEDRLSHWTGVQLTLLSLRKHSPEIDVVAHLPGATAGQRAWLAAHVPYVELRAGSVDGSGGWNVKPSLLMAELASGAAEVLWIDSDVLMARPLHPMLGAHPPEALLVAADNSAAPLHGTDDRTRAWGLPVGRPMPRAVNSGFLRALPWHEKLLADWQAMLATPEYRRAQQQPWHERPLHFWGDQEVLTALLGSTRAEGVAVSQLRAGVEMAQSQGPRGWSVSERLRAGVHGGPTMVHSMGPKPWLVPHGPARDTSGLGLRWWLADIQVRSSPYMRLALNYREELGETGAWLDESGADRCTGPRTCALPGLPLAIATSPVVLAKRREDRRLARGMASWVERHGPFGPFLEESS